MAAWYLAPQRMPFVVATLLTGGAGVAGTVLVLVLHAVQHLAYGDTHGVETFLEGSTHATPLLRLAALAVCGLVASVGWRALEAFGKPRAASTFAASRVGLRSWARGMLTPLWRSCQDGRHRGPARRRPAPRGNFAASVADRTAEPSDPGWYGSC
jgi:hypothetical protein